MHLEICANSFQSAINAQNAGADRIELCSELALGGITPSYGLIKKTVKHLKVPVFVLIRPRSGNFTYSDEEFSIMKEDIVMCKQLGVSGIVSGALNSDHTIDIERTKALIELSKPLPFTFHRAFDWVPKPFEALEQLLSLNVDRILSSGQSKSARDGIGLLKDLNMAANKKLVILPGGGINPDNVLLFKITGFDEIHCSATKTIQIIDKPKISMNSERFFDETLNITSNESVIQSILKKIKE